jgi:hypothetical protein
VKAPAEPSEPDGKPWNAARQEPSVYLRRLEKGRAVGRPSLLQAVLGAAMAFSLSSLFPVVAEDGTLAAVATGPGGRSQAGDAVLDVSLADAGLVVGDQDVRIFPGFPGGLPNDPPVASDGYGTRVAGSGLRFPATTASFRGSDADGDQMRVVAVDPVSGRGARVELDGDQIRYRPPAGMDEADSFGFVLADSYGDTATARIRVLVVPNPNPVDPAGDLLRSRVDDDGHVELRFAALPGQLYRIESATNLVPPIRWETVAEVRAAADGRVVHSGPDIPGEPVRYYRLVP